MGLLTKIRNILIIIKIFYWFAFKASIKALWRKDLSLAHNFWAEYSYEYFKVKSIKLQNSKQMRRQKHILLTNHRTQADFFVHTVLVDGQANFLSRLMVGIVFFIFYISGRKTIWFFNRSGNIQPDKFNKWLDEKYSKSDRPLLIAYPQGHRMGAATKVEKQKLKTGMIRYAYRSAIPIQIFMTFGNQAIFNEKKLDMKWNQKVYYSFSNTISPSDFESQNEFVRVVKDEFVKFFDTVYEQYRIKAEEDKIDHNKRD